jgi:hypothetical protein
MSKRKGSNRKAKHANDRRKEKKEESKKENKKRNRA